MAYEVIWTLHAEEDYRQIIFYLKKEWSENVAQNFIKQQKKELNGLLFSLF